MTERAIFENTPDFCPNCGSIFPHLRSTGIISCYTCGEDFSPEVLGGMELNYTIYFNSYDPNKFKKVIKIKQEKEEPDGPIAERKCSNCGNEQMSYATAQLRSADEGQTVFFTCTKCQHKETENS